MRFGAVLLATGLLLAGCHSAPSLSPSEKDAARDAEVQKLKGWDRAFRAPPEAVAAANQFGFKAGNYSKADVGYRSQGGPVTIANSFSKAPSQVSFEAAGDDPALIDRFTFKLAIGGREDARTARQRFSKLVKDFLFRFGLKDDDGVVKGIADGQDYAGKLGEAMATITLDPAASGDAAKSITVTFNRPAGMAPGSKPQGK